MLILRSLIFNAVFVVYHLALILGLTALMPFPRMWSQGFVRMWTQGGKALLKGIVGLGVEFRGLQNLPQGPCVIVSKHQSAWDTFAFYILADDPNYILKKELTRIPFWGWCALSCGAISVDRSGGGAALKGLLRDTQDRLAKGRQVVIFPEGTRTAPGARLDYFPGVAAIDGHTDVPIVPVALNSGLFWGRGSFLKKPGVITIEILPPMAKGLKRRQFMTDLESRIEGASDKLMAEAREHFPNL
ncbi:MAG TPA: lysophospholipid acyltransferase family protein [Rhodospirillales bacterium]|jgi:1-acyl-sn-glycerol-3-phosphate acyltransferase|nr:lysophospholipid acyltransferase family protein [Rhodospirillales bacterium]